MKLVLIYSGGLDSTTLLYDLRAREHEVAALGVNYGQRHARELEAAADICKMLGVEHRVADLRSITPLLGGSSQTDRSIEVPEGHYTDESMKRTVVPNRNMIMLSVAAGWALSKHYDGVAYAAHAGDHAIYPDCRETFAEPLAAALKNADWKPLRLERPFIAMTKSDIVRLGQRLHVPYEMTWSCYKGGERHCGKCGTCVERIEAFHLAEVPDPTPYQP